MTTIFLVAPNRQQADYWLRQFGTPWRGPDHRVVFLSMDRHRDEHRPPTSPHGATQRLHGHRWRDGDEFLIVGDHGLMHPEEIRYVARYLMVPEDVLAVELQAAFG